MTWTVYCDESWSCIINYLSESLRALLNLLGIHWWCLEHFVRWLQRCIWLILTRWIALVIARIFFLNRSSWTLKGNVDIELHHLLLVFYGHLGHWIDLWSLHWTFSTWMAWMIIDFLNWTWPRGWLDWSWISPLGALRLSGVGMMESSKIKTA